MEHLKNKRVSVGILIVVLAVLVSVAGTPL
jgi:hypothetical protein